jgi:geranylgeranyl diphosphate synthase type I
VIAGADDAVLRTLEELGHALGPLFQIKDDVIDLTSGKGRGQVGNDIREGKRSFLVAAAAERGTDAEREKLYAVLDTEREKTSDENVDSIIQIFKKTGALVEAERVCEELLKRGHDCIEALPNQLHAVLHIITEVLAKRSN